MTMTMQGADLKTIRNGLNLTQDDFAREIGMSRKAINEMEGGKTPIERRTELAARYLAHIGSAKT